MADVLIRRDSETEVGVILLKAKEHQGMPASMRSQERGMRQTQPLSPKGGTDLANTLIFSGLLAWTLRQHISAVFSFPVCGTWLQEPWKLIPHLSRFLWMLSHPWSALDCHRSEHSQRKISILFLCVPCCLEDSIPWKIQCCFWKDDVFSL